MILIYEFYNSDDKKKKKKKKTKKEGKVVHSRYMQMFEKKEDELKNEKNKG
jgi:hypothetical protein